MTEPTSLSIQTLIRAVEDADSPARLVAAVRNLAATQSETAIPTLIQVLGYNNPGAAVAAMDGLIQLGSIAVQPLLELLDDYNYGARAYAIRALSTIADPRALEVLLSTAATDFAPSVRRAAAKGLGYLHWEQLPPEQAASAQAQATETLLQISQDPEWAIRYAAVVGLHALMHQSQVPLPIELAQSIHSRWQVMVSQDADLAVRSRVWYAQHPQANCIA